MLYRAIKHEIITKRKLL